ncbi:hypothetical protein BS50DRAFT_676231 [Corynespora cassiicola Philippines]|uniref:Uncharacterized protein n=1 Tax=Corynespora cassiicola Philippines TaxID=1448308 RepID=A0A2T2NSJ0_CORCC|nr:hypothetical protein BS50DRAFT_676231 [Corynespora cassiicola Philippines]
MPYGSPLTGNNKAIPQMRFIAAARRPTVDIALLRSKLILASRPYVPKRLLLEANEYLKANNRPWVDPTNKNSSPGKKRFFVLDIKEWTFDRYKSGADAAAAARIDEQQYIEAGNGVVLFVKTAREWRHFMRGYHKANRGLCKEWSQTMEESGLVPSHGPAQIRQVERRWKREFKNRMGSTNVSRNEFPMRFVLEKAVKRVLRT